MEPARSQLPAPASRLRATDRSWHRRRHVARPGPVLVAHRDLARAGSRHLALTDFSRVEIAAQVDPRVAARVQALLDRAIGVQVVVADHRERRIDEPVVDAGALEQFFGGALEAKGPALDQRLVDGDRLDDADRLDRALDRQARVVAVSYTHLT